MEQATNQFNKGLQMDTHPMVQSNDSLTDCLNGTLITMNGNEVILQNDMGNRRVNNAFLPPGYQPIGIKEYGGIIYIAAYNPITNKSQIGSFPSPQKKFKNLDFENQLNFDKFLEESNEFEETFDLGSKTQTLNFVKSDTQFVLLTEDSSIYPGDKFTVYCSTIDKNKDKLTNYDNIYHSDEHDQIYSPKNKDYTLFLGVLNSQNEFMDITPNLQRWKWDKEHKKSEIINFNNDYNYEVSKNFKFNSGYFIPKSFDNENLEETQADADFIRNRQAFPINTYSSKLVGPLYLKAQFNHVENFDYNIHGYKSIEGDDEYVYLTIDGFFTYNCQDHQENNEENNEYQNIQIFNTNKEQENNTGDYISDRVMNGRRSRGYYNDIDNNDNDIDNNNDNNNDNVNINNNIIMDGINVNYPDEFPENLSSNDYDKLGIYGTFLEDDLMYRYSSSKDNNKSENIFNVNDNSTDDSFVTIINYNQVSPYEEESMDNHYINWTVYGDVNPVKVIIDDDNSSNWTLPTIYGDDEKWLCVDHSSLIKVFSTNIDRCIETIEIVGEAEDFRLLNGFGKQSKISWNAGYSTTRRVEFYCQSAKIKEIRVKTRNISEKKKEIWNKHLQYSAQSKVTGISDFNFETDSTINLYNPLKYLSDSLYGNHLFSGSGIISFDRYSEIHFTKTTYYPKGAAAILLYDKMEFLVEVPNQYSISTIEIFSSPNIKCLSPGKFENNVWSNIGGSTKAVRFRFESSDNYGYLYRVIVHHNGICSSINDDRIKRNYKYEILEWLQRKGSSITLDEARNLTIIIDKSKNTNGLVPNKTQRMVVVNGRKEDGYKVPIMYGHFEPYQLKQSDLDKITDGYTRNVDDYLAIRLVYDVYTKDYDNLISITPWIEFKITRDSFGDNNFGKYLQDCENSNLNPENCISNNEYFFLANLV